jgi:hypothetical protein
MNRAWATEGAGESLPESGRGGWVEPFTFRIVRYSTTRTKAMALHSWKYSKREIPNSETGKGLPLLQRKHLWKFTFLLLNFNHARHA